MLIDSIENGTFKLAEEITVKADDDVTEIIRKQTPDDLAHKDRLHYDIDIKAVNILLLGLLVEIYTLINHYQTAKEIWKRVKELMESTEMTKQEHKMLLAQAQEARVALNEEEQDFLADSLEENDDIMIFNYTPQQISSLSSAGSLNDDTVAPTYDFSTLTEELLEEARALKPLDEHIGHAFKFAEHIQELLVYVSASCPFTESGNEKDTEKLVAVTPKNKDKKVRFVDPVSSSNNTQKHVDAHKNQDSNQPLLHSIGVICSTSGSRSQLIHRKRPDE
uniref:Retrovirus-related Pol polyprotein from transposon TNT 1-94 n=1 Tax=Tanacetum cinerariifolium TaxID=118510 RepID=A0A6L2MGP6_TANCI|nr:hypothetical protein [Tanacetum cinerariifolium]